MPNTLNRGYPVPERTETPDVQLDLQQLAETIDADMQGRADDIATEQDRITDTRERVTALEADTGWQTPSLVNQFSGTSDYPPRFRRKGGLVFMVGEVLRSAAPSSPTLVFTLPTGFRPSRRNRYMTALDNSGPILIDVRETGEVYMSSANTRTTTPGLSVAVPPWIAEA